MKQIYHFILGFLGLITMALAYIISKIFGAFAPAEKKRSEPWLENFIILYFAKCLKVDGDNTDITRLSRGDLNFGQTQSLLVYLKSYLHKIGKPFGEGDLKDVLESIPRVWAIHTTGFQSEGAVRVWCQNQNPDGSKSAVDTFVNTVKNIDKKSEDWLHLSRELLVFRIERAFTRKHGADFYSYTDTMVEDYIELRDANSK